MCKEDLISYLERILYQVESYPDNQLNIESLYDVVDSLINLTAMCQKELLIMTKNGS